jgi:hypothetical protein
VACPPCQMAGRILRRDRDGTKTREYAPKCPDGWVM